MILTVNSGRSHFLGCDLNLSFCIWNSTTSCGAPVLHRQLYAPCWPALSLSNHTIYFQNKRGGNQMSLDFYWLTFVSGREIDGRQMCSMSSNSEDVWEHFILHLFFIIQQEEFSKPVHYFLCLIMHRKQKQLKTHAENRFGNTWTSSSVL